MNESFSVSNDAKSIARLEEVPLQTALFQLRRKFSRALLRQTDDSTHFTLLLAQTICDGLAQTCPGIDWNFVQTQKHEFLLSSSHNKAIYIAKNWSSTDLARFEVQHAARDKIGPAINDPSSFVVINCLTCAQYASSELYQHMLDSNVYYILLKIDTTAQRFKVYDRESLQLFQNKSVSRKRTKSDMSPPIPLLPGSTDPSLLQINYQHKSTDEPPLKRERSLDSVASLPPNARLARPLKFHLKYRDRTKVVEAASLSELKKIAKRMARSGALLHAGVTLKDRDDFVLENDQDLQLLEGNCVFVEVERTSLWGSLKRALFVRRAA